MTQSLEPFPNGEFDIDVFRMLTLKRTKMIKAYPQLYRFLTSKSGFYDEGRAMNEFACCIVRFKIIDDSYKCIITNLSRKKKINIAGNLCKNVSL